MNGLDDTLASYQQAYTAAREGNLESALAHVQAATAEGGWPAAWTLHAEILNDLGRPEEASSEAGNALAAKTDDEHALYKLGRAHAELGEIERAMDCLSRALSVNPSAIRSRRLLCQLSLERGEKDRARDLAATGVQVAPGNPRAHHVLVDTLEGAGTAEEAGRALAAAVETCPANARLRYRLAGYLLDPNPTEAREHAAIAVEMRPNVARYLNRLRVAQKRLGETPSDAFEARGDAFKLHKAFIALRRSVARRWRGIRRTLRNGREHT